MANIKRSTSQLGSMTGKELFDRIQPFMHEGAEIGDVSGVVVVVTYTNGAIEVSGPHGTLERGMILARALSYMQESLTKDDVIDFMVEQEDIPDDISGLDQS